MKYLFKTLIIFTVIFFALKFILFFFDTGHTVDYNIGNFKVEEELRTKENNYYYFQLEHEDFKINFAINQNYNKAEKVINNIEYKKIDDYSCVLPIFKNGDILTDVMCLKDDEITYAHDLDNENINDYLKSLEKYGYDVNNYKDKASEVKLSNTQSVYQDNLLENHYIAMETYKGLNLFGASQDNIQIFDDDVYTKPISFFTDRYYIVADYTEDYTFKRFHVINRINGKQTDIRSYDDISFETIMQGAVDDEIYFFDKETELQYKISLKYENVEEVADKDKLQYYNGKWNSMALSDALEGKTFDNYYTKAPNGYEKADCIGEDTGYCYYYKKQMVDDKEQYLVYRADVQNTKIKTYLFTTTDMRSVIYLDNFVYFVNGNSLYYYGENGVRQVIANSEREFNDDIHFGVYIN